MSVYRLKDVLTPRVKRRNRLTRLMDRVEKEQNSLEIVQALLPQPDARHCIGASMRGTTLVVMADSASWASRIRFRCKYLVKELQQVEQFAKIQKAIVVTNATLRRANSSN